MKRIKSELQEKVEAILASYERSRDSDALLVSMLYKKFYFINDNLSFFKVMEKVHHGILPTIESITRCRRKIQEDGKYRGFKYSKRKEIAKNVKSQIQNWK